MKEIDKLIRDKIPEINEKNWVEQKIIIESWGDLERRFFDKMFEEVEEIKQSKSISEIADLFEVLFSYVKFKWFSLDEVEKIRQKKKEERGSFEKGIVLLRLWKIW